MGFTCSETEAWNIARSSSNNSRMWLHKKLHEDTHGNSTQILFSVYCLGQCRLYQKRVRSFMTSIEFRHARQKLGMSMVEASTKCGVPYRTWQDWEAGKRRVPPWVKCLLFYLERGWTYDANRELSTNRKSPRDVRPPGLEPGTYWLEVI